MAISFENLVCNSVLLVGEHSSTLMHFPGICGGKTLVIKVGTFIAVEYFFDISMVNTRMFVIVDGPPSFGERTTVIIEYHTLGKVIPRILCLMEIPPNPLLGKRADPCLNL